MLVSKYGTKTIYRKYGKESSSLFHSWARLYINILNNHNRKICMYQIFHSQFLRSMQFASVRWKCWLIQRWEKQWNWQNCLREQPALCPANVCRPPGYRPDILRSLSFQFPCISLKHVLFSPPFMFHGAKIRSHPTVFVRPSAGGEPNSTTESPQSSQRRAVCK